MLTETDHLEKIRHYTPFDISSRKFKLTFLDDYLLPLTQWLERPDKDVLLAQESNSPWETAITIETLLKALTFTQEHRPDWFGANKARIGTKIVNAVPWLLERAENVEIDPARYGLTWETVTWDTSTVARALLSIRGSAHLDIPAKQIADIDEAVAKSLIWQARMIKNWPKEGKYAFSAADTALVAMCFVDVIRQQNRIGRQLIKDELLRQENLVQLLVECIDILLNWARPIPFALEGMDCSQLQPCWWSDYFVTAEVIEALASFHAIVCLAPSAWDKGIDPFAGIQPDTLSGQIVRVRESIASGMILLGASQDGGLWGSHVDTLRALNCYLGTGSKLRAPVQIRPGLELGHYSFEPEIDVAFKAIRFVCDYKQFFSDKSYQHSVYLSVFCAMAFTTAFEHWAPAELPTETLYDEVIWAAPTRTDESRSMLARAQLANERQARDLNQKIEHLAESRQIWRVQANRRLRYLRFGIVGLVVISIMAAVLIQFHMVVVGLGEEFDEGKVSAVVAAGTVIFGMLVFLLDAVTRGDEKDGNNE